MSITSGHFVDGYVEKSSRGVIIKLARGMLDVLQDDRLAGEENLNLSEERSMLLHFSRQKDRMNPRLGGNLQCRFSFSHHIAAESEFSWEEGVSLRMLNAVCDAIDEAYPDRFMNRRVRLQVLHYLIYTVGVSWWGSST